MYKRCVTEYSARRQKEIEQGLLTILENTRYETITVMSLCQTLNIPRKTFYRYFSSKDGALYALIDHTIMEFSETILGREPVSFQTLQRFFELWLQHERFLHVMVRNRLSGVSIQRTILHFTQEATSAQLLSSALPDQYKITFILSGLMALVLQWHEAHFSPTPKEMAAIAAQLLLEPIYKPI